jgi:hypothetical protein
MPAAMNSCCVLGMCNGGGHTATPGSGLVAYRNQQQSEQKSQTLEQPPPHPPLSSITHMTPT